MNTQHIIKKSLVIILTLVMLLSVVVPAMAQENGIMSDRNLPIVSSPDQGPTDPAELEAFLDDYFAKQMGDYHNVGAAISVVKDGKLFFFQGLWLRRP